MTDKMLSFNGFSCSIIDYAVRANSIIGIRKAGKTYAGTYICEQLLDAGIPCYIIDPSSTWKNLKVSNGSATGKAYDIVTIGSNGDIVIDDSFDPESIVEIVEKALVNNVSLIFDLYRPIVTRDTQERILELAFQTIFLKNEGIKSIFVEEATTFCPQNKKAYSRRLYEILEEITRVGGNCQLGINYLAQRAEQLNKECFELCDMVLLFRQRGNNSLKAIKKWLSMGVVDDVDIEKILDSMPTLNSGEAWVLEQESQTPHRITVPSKNSSHPDRGRFTESYLEKSKMVDVRKFVDDTNSLGKEEIAYTQPKPVLNIPIFIQEEKSTEIELPDIDSMELTAYEKNIGYLAHKTPFGNSTVGSTVDNLIKKGYITYKEHPSQLFNEKTNKDFGLNSNIERNYAKLIIKLLNK